MSVSFDLILLWTSSLLHIDLTEIDMYYTTIEKLTETDTWRQETIAQIMIPVRLSSTRLFEILKPCQWQNGKSFLLEWYGPCHNDSWKSILVYIRYSHSSQFKSLVITSYYWGRVLVRLPASDCRIPGSDQIQDPILRKSKISGSGIRIREN